MASGFSDIGLLSFVCVPVLSRRNLCIILNIQKQLWFKRDAFQTR